MTPFVVFLHVGSALVLVGEVLFASFWLRASFARVADLGVTRYVVTTMTLTSRRVAFPAILVNLLTGIVLVPMSGVTHTGGRWLLVSIVLYAIMSGLWHGRLIPLRKKMAAVIEGTGSGPLPPEYTALARTWGSVSAQVVALAAMILALMIWKPTFR
jgi:uncharacterized membrane protein